jgi:hypothetical protein
MEVTVVYALPEHQFIRKVKVTDRALVAEALAVSGVLEAYPDIDWAREAIGVWGRVRSLTTPLRPGDRVEIYRPRQGDPKVQRRARLKPS